MPHSLLTEQKLRYKQHFDKVFANRKRLSSLRFLAYYRKSDLSYSRIGVMCAKRNVRSAVERNRIRRVLKEQFRLNQHDLPAVDLVFVAKKEAGKANNNELRTCIDKLLTKIITSAAK